MKRDHDGKANNEVGVELKYCEHCGSLWVRERGAGTVYCDRCQSKVADLPTARKKPGRLILPVRPHTTVEDFEFEIEVDIDVDVGVDIDVDIDVEDSTDFDALGGAA
jgi:hypothetical protein